MEDVAEAQELLDMSADAAYEDEEEEAAPIKDEL